MEQERDELVGRVAYLEAAAAASAEASAEARAAWAAEIAGLQGRITELEAQLAEREANCSALEQRILDL